MRATGNRASLKVAQAFSQRNRWKKYLICQQQNKGIQLHIPDNLRLLRQLRVAVASGQDSNLARFQALRTWLHFIQSLWDKTSASPMLTRMRDCGARSRSFAFLREGLKFCCHDLW
jgi:hypothetical protein